jgi:hypothetical protein
VTEIIGLLDKYGVAVGVLACLLYAMARFATWASGHVDSVVRSHLGLIDALRKESEERIVQGMQSSEALHQIATLNASHLPQLEKLAQIEKGISDHQSWSERAVEALRENSQRRP